MALLIDHLWQSVLFFTLVACLSWLTRRNSAALRLWLWRSAALKFLLPFSLLFALGGWLGFPVRHNAIAPPAALVGAVERAQPWVMPAQSLAPGHSWLLAGLVIGLGVATACGWFILRRLRSTKRQLAQEAARIDVDWTQEPPRLEFFNATTLAACAFSLLAAPLVSGALHDRLRRQEALVIDIEKLRHAGISLKETPTVFGLHTQIKATGNGVLIQHVNLQDLVALAYGIDEFEVFGGALPWLETPHYDVRVSGPVHSPAVFDPYSLRQPVTDYLSREYGVAIRVNGNCQEPCLNQESFVVERIP